MRSRAIREEMREEDVTPIESLDWDGDLVALLEQGNIVDFLPSGAGSEVIQGYEDADNTMKEWYATYEKALRLAKMQPKEKHKTFPFDGASTAMAPFVLESMIDFNARSAPELAYSDNIVKVKTYGNVEAKDIVPSPPSDFSPEFAQLAAQAAQMTSEDVDEQLEDAKDDRADRVKEYSNYQLQEEIPNWPVEMDKCLLTLPGVGTMYKKTFYDDGQIRSDLCYPDQVKFDMNYPTFESAPDKYEPLPPMSKNEVIERIRGNDGWMIDEDNLGDDNEYEFKAGYTWFDLDDDGLKEPYYVIVWCKNSQAVYSRPLFDEDTIEINDNNEVVKVEMVDIFTQYQYMPDPSGGPMGMGWGIILGPMFEEINSAMRRQMDAGTLQVLASNSGLIAADTTSGRGNSAQRGPIEMAMGKLTPISVRGGASLQQNVVQFPAAGPSPALFNLMEYMVEAARRLTDASSQVDANANEAAMLYLARLQQTLKRPNVITMRVYRAAKAEFKKIHLLNYKHFSDEKYNKVLDRSEAYSMQSDFNPDDCDLVLVADPSQGSDLERAARAEAIYTEAKMDQSGVWNVREAATQWLDVLNAKDPEKLIPPPSNEPDPMTQLMIQREQVEADLRQRDQRLREQGQQIQAAKLQLEQAKAQMQAMKEAQELGLEYDYKESQITKNYADALKTLSEITVDPMQAVRDLEQEFLGNSSLTATEGGRNVARVDATPASNAGANRPLVE